MPDTARFVADICCSQCGTHLLNSARCSWGGLPGPAYAIGDRIRWVRSDNGEILPSFVLFRTGPGGADFHWNCGDPSTHGALVFDEDIYTGNHTLSCGQCQTKIAAIRVVIAQGMFIAAQAVTSEEVARELGASKGRAFAMTKSADGPFTPREEWFDHPIPFTEHSGVRP